MTQGSARPPPSTWLTLTPSAGVDAGLRARRRYGCAGLVARVRVPSVAALRVRRCRRSDERARTARCHAWSGRWPSRRRRTPSRCSCCWLAARCVGMIQPVREKCRNVGSDRSRAGCSSCILGSTWPRSSVLLRSGAVGSARLSPGREGRKARPPARLGPPCRRCVRCGPTAGPHQQTSSRLAA